MSTPFTRIALCVVLAALCAADPMRALGRAASPWARRELARRADAAEQRYLATLPSPEPIDPEWVLVARIERGHALVVAGTVRVVIEGERWRAARERTRDVIAAVARGVAGRWLFATVTGDVFRSASFDGTLEPVGAVACPAPVSHPSDGRIVLQDPSGSLWSTTGEAPPTRIHGVPGLVTAAFVDAHRGAAIASGGALFVTIDGGETWQPRDLGSESAFALTRSAAGLVANVTGGPALLVASAPDPEARAQLDERELRAVRAASDESARMHFRIVSTGSTCRPAASEVHRGEREAIGPLGIYGALGDAARSFEGWQLPAFTLVDPHYRPDWTHGFPSTYPIESGAHRDPLAPRSALGRVESRTGAGPIAVTLSGPDEDPVATFSWRGIDERRAAFRGSASAAVRATRAALSLDRDNAGQPPVLPDFALVAATRRGVLLDPHSERDSNAASEQLVWLGPNGPVPVHVGIETLVQLGALPLDDGGAVVIASAPASGPVASLWSGRGHNDSFSHRRGLGMLYGEGQRHPTPAHFDRVQLQQFALARIDAEGTVRASRTFAWPAREDRFVGLLESPVGWSLVRADDDTGSALRSYPLAARGSRDVPAPIAHDDAPPCTHAASATRLHAFPEAFPMGNAITIGPGMDGPEYAECGHIAYDITDGRLCVARIDASRPREYSADDAEAAPRAPSRAAVHFFPVRNAFDGPVDDGTTQSRVRARFDRYQATMPE